MKIIGDQDRLVLKSQSWILLLFGGCALAVVLGMAMFIPLSAELRCERDADGAGQCELSEASLVRSDAVSYDIRDVVGAIVEQSSDSESDSCRVSLTVEGRSNPVSSWSVWTDCSGEMRARAAEINAFLASSEPATLEQEQSIPWWFLVPVLVVILVLLELMNLGRQGRYFVFDREAGTLEHAKRARLFGKRRVTRVPLSDIKSVHVREYDDDDDLRYSVDLEMADGEILSLTEWSSLTPSEKESIVERLDALLDCPRTGD